MQLRANGTDPEHEALLADSVGLALLVVSKRSPRRSGSRSCCTTCSPFLAASRDGDFDALVAVLDPDEVQIALAPASAGAKATIGRRGPS